MKAEKNARFLHDKFVHFMPKIGQFFQDREAGVATNFLTHCYSAKYIMASGLQHVKKIISL